MYLWFKHTGPLSAKGSPIEVTDEVLCSAVNNVAHGRWIDT